MKRSIQVAFCGVLAALSAAVMFLTGVFPTATLGLTALAGCALIPAVAELGAAWGFGTYAVVAALSLLLAPDREAALLYVLFFGYYPALYGVLARIGKRPLRAAAKLLLFNAAMAGEALLSVFVLGIPWESVSFLGAATVPALLALANLAFLLYDRALGSLIALYFQRARGPVRRILRGK